MEYEKLLEELGKNGFTEEDAGQGGLAFLGSKRDLKAAAEHVRSTEKPLAIAGGSYYDTGGVRAGIDNAVFLITDKRLIRVNKKVKNSDIISYYIKDINSSAYKTSFLSSKLMIATTSGTMEISQVRKDTAKKFNDVLLNLIDKEKSAPKGGTAALSGMDEVRKAKKLLDEGIISQKEFDDIKKKHIG